jgi:hypothetical protein
VPIITFLPQAVILFLAEMTLKANNMIWDIHVITLKCNDCREINKAIISQPVRSIHQSSEIGFQWEKGKRVNAMKLTAMGCYLKQLLTSPYPLHVLDLSNGWLRLCIRNSRGGQHNLTHSACMRISNPHSIHFPRMVGFYLWRTRH